MGREGVGKEFDSLIVCEPVAFIERAVVDPLKPLGNPGGLRHRTAAPIEPGPVAQAVGLHDERVAVPFPNRVAVGNSSGGCTTGADRRTV